MSDTCTPGNDTGFLSAHKLFSDHTIASHLKFSVILPVRNEEDNLKDALDALRSQTDKFGKPLSHQLYEVLLLANNCTDNSVAIARSYQKRHPGFAIHIEEINLPTEIAHIGTVRRLLMDAAYERLTSHDALGSGVIASTDSDSQVDAQWIYQTITEIENGNDVVGGRILTRPEKSTSRLYYLRDINYKHLVSKIEDLIDPVNNDRWPRHFQCFGASFAVTCRIYDLSGRLPVVPFLEDMAFHKSLIRVDAKIRMSPLVKVFTSSRIDGRVDFGLSQQLKQWGEMKECSHPLLVEPAGSLVVKLKARRLLREFWMTHAQQPMDQAQKLLSEVCNVLNLEYNWLLQQVETASYFGNLWEKIEEVLLEHGWRSIWPAMDVVDVIPQLKMEISRISSQPSA